MLNFAWCFEDFGWLAGWLAAGWLLAMGYWLLATGYWLAAGCLAAGWQDAGWLDG